jgi:peptidoglycan/xylan/chitin deacetylase (PgdA/CDA1 family)
MRRLRLDSVRRRARPLTRRRPGRLGVLAYHRVATSQADPWALSVTSQHFDEQLAVLRQRGHVDRLDEALGAPPLARCRRRRPTFAITFDDGYVDNLLDAVALLERHDAPATVFIITGMLDEPSFWWDVLAELALASGISGDRLIESGISLGLLAAHARRDHADAAGAHALLYDALAPRPGAEIQRCLGELSAEVEVAVPVPAGRPMTTGELQQIASHPLINIGIHTVNHRRLTLLPAPQVRAELADAVARLDDLLGVRPRALAYPYGATSASVAAIASSIGVPYAVTTARRWVGLREDPMRIPRLHPHDLASAPFGDWIS